ncbi:MAG: prepilin-type N-terminal cleavage/methylation domain-containing protein [Deltaproteobacteria bacterium]|uniref:Prepilin-type N-terminal cleavage/methylation domain-containing protein n=1 Tax=Candidatus Zymogenus saltonus TaxID=2844893 RepID=A0A9D8KC28_9DELT|nr:prepilin-type N-terminal cleavage/methylation domain-containing protein [Candidatus Zymogenus saltonus]
MMKRIVREGGFTLLELLVVVSIIAISTSIAVPTFISWAPKFRLNSAADNLEKNLMLARISAISQNSNVIVNFFESQRKYTVTYKDKTEIIELPEGTHFSGIGTSTLTFNKIGQADSNMEIKIYSDSNKLTDKKRKITVRAVTGIARVSRGW